MSKNRNDDQSVLKNLPLQCVLGASEDLGHVIQFLDPLDAELATG